MKTSQTITKFAMNQTNIARKCILNEIKYLHIIPQENKDSQLKKQGCNE